jgi:hypothetical protein
MENLIVAFTNITVILPIITALQNKDHLTAVIIGFTGIASFISHLFENHKHNMPGIYPVSKKCSYILNRFDVFGVFLIGLRFAYMYYQKYNMTLNMEILPYLSVIALNLLSEYDKYNPALKTRYIVLHSLWHLSAFYSIDCVLKKIFYKN